MPPRRRANQPPDEIGEEGWISPCLSADRTGSRPGVGERFLHFFVRTPTSENPRRHAMKTERESRRPPMEQSDEADAKQLDFARQQGEVLGRVADFMMHEEADDGGENRAGDYLVALRRGGGRGAPSLEGRRSGVA